MSRRTGYDGDHLPKGAKDVPLTLVAEQLDYDPHQLLGGQIREARASRGMTQKELAERACVRQSEVSRIEGGSANPTVLTLAALAWALDLQLQLIPVAQGEKRRSPR